MENYHYGIIGNCQSAALISKRGSIDYCCLPDFDSPSVFFKLLDEKKGGHFGIEVDGTYNISQFYIEKTNVLQTVFDNGMHAFAVCDFMPRYERGFRSEDYYCPPDIIRYFKVEKGTPQIALDFSPALNYAQGKTEVEVHSDYLKCSSIGTSYETAYLYSNFDLNKIKTGESFQLKNEGFVLISYNQKIFSPSQEDMFLQLQKTIVYWLDWESKTPKRPAYNEAISRSALVLKLLTYQETGAVLAALTTSLPETIGEERNWDYRFCWVRDASMTISIFTELKHNSTVRRYIKYILNIIPLKDEKIQIMYGIRGQKNLAEKKLDHLSGYKDSKPVRIGNAAFEQKQNDIYGILMDVLHSSLNYIREELDTVENVWTIARTLVRNVKTHWREPDRGIWEYRGKEEHFVFSKVLCWVAVDRGIKIAKSFNRQDYVKEWEPLRDEIKRDIDTKGWNEEVRAYTQFYGSKQMDAANLLMEYYGFIEGRDPRYVSTVKQIEKELCVDGFMYRYKNEDDFGTPKSSFTVCTFWMVNAWYRSGEQEKAKKMFDNLLGFANHLGLFSEDIDFESKRLLGNFPQAYSHLALITTAMALSGKESLPEEDRLHNIFHD